MDGRQIIGSGGAATIDSTGGGIPTASETGPPTAAATTIRVASVPASHVYVRHLSPVNGTVSALDTGKVSVTRLGRPSTGGRGEGPGRMVAPAHARPRLDRTAPQRLRRVPHPLRLRRGGTLGDGGRPRTPQARQAARLHPARPAQSASSGPRSPRRGPRHPRARGRRTDHADPRRRGRDLPALEPRGHGHPAPPRDPSAPFRPTRTRDRRLRGRRPREERPREHRSAAGHPDAARRRVGLSGRDDPDQSARRDIRSRKPLVQPRFRNCGTSAVQAPVRERAGPRILRRRPAVGLPPGIVGLGPVLPLRHPFRLARGMPRSRYRGDRPACGFYHEQRDCFTYELTEDRFDPTPSSQHSRTPTRTGRCRRCGRTGAPAVSIAEQHAALYTRVLHA